MFRVATHPDLVNGRAEILVRRDEPLLYGVFLES